MDDGNHWRRKYKQNKTLGGMKWALQRGGTIVLTGVWIWEGKAYSEREEADGVAPGAL